MYTISFLLRKTSAKPGARHTLYARIHPGDIPVSTHEKLLPDAGKKKGEWDHSGQKVRPVNPSHLLINARLAKIKVALEAYLRTAEETGEPVTNEKLYAIVNPVRAKKRAERKLAAKPRVQAKTPEQVHAAWAKDYLEEKNLGNKGDIKGERYVNSYRQTVDWLYKFNPALTITDLTNAGTIKEFRRYLLQNSALQDSTMARHMKGIRIFLTYMGYSKAHVKGPKNVKATQYALSWKEVVQLRKFAYANENHQKAADIFVADCQVCLRFQDLFLPKPETILDITTMRHGVAKCININQGKTGDQVYIPFPPMAGEIMQRYDWLFPLDRKTQSDLKNSSNLNKRLKAAAKEAGLTRMVRTTTKRGGHVEETWRPLHEIISIHDARHTGSTLIQEATGDKALADALLGHATDSVYTHANPVLIVDKLLEAWKKIENSGG